MERTAVENSTQIASIGYDHALKLLEIEFKAGGSVYQYEGVPADMADAFAKADSKGRFLSEHIKKAFPAKRVA